MGTYYIVICHYRKEFIDPAWICDDASPNGYGINASSVISGSLMNVVAHRAISGNWNGCDFRIVGDCYDEYKNAEDTYDDVSEEAITEFLKYLGEDRVKRDFRNMRVRNDDETIHAR